MLTVSRPFPAPLGLARVHETHLALLGWLRAQSGIVMYGGDGFDGGRGRTYNLERQRQIELLRYMALRWEQLGLDNRLTWYPWVRWSTKRFLGEQATRSQHASWPRTLASLERRGLVERMRNDPKRGRTTALRLTELGVEALHAIAATRGARLDTRTISFPRNLREIVLVPEALDHKWVPGGSTSLPDQQRYSRRLQIHLFRGYELAEETLSKKREKGPGRTLSDRGSVEPILKRLRLRSIVDFEKQATALEKKLGLISPQ